VYYLEDSLLQSFFLRKLSVAEV